MRDVHLPTHTVIIKGTQVYNREKRSLDRIRRCRCYANKILIEKNCDYLIYIDT